MTMGHSKQFIRVLKILILVLSYGYLYYHFSHRSFSIADLSISANSFFFLGFTLLLMVVNWILEAKKWQCLTQPIETISWLTALKATLTGLTASVITPNRVGDYVSRMWVLEKSNYSQGVAATVLSSMVQTAITLFFGMIALLQYLSFSKLTHQTMYLLFGSLLLTGLLLVIFLLPKWLSQKKGKIGEAFYFAQHLPKTIMLKAFIFGILRYGIFIIQLWLLFYAVEAPLPLSAVFIGMGLVYGVSLFIPSVSLSEPALRGGLGIGFFAVFTHNESVVLSAIVLLWLINVALPAMIGSVFLWKMEINLKSR